MIRKTTASAVLFSLLTAGAALAQPAAPQEPVVNGTLLWHVPRYLAKPQPKGLTKLPAGARAPLAVDPLAIYSNLDNATGSAFNNFTPIVTQFTAIRADDITFTTNPGVGQITNVVLAVYNGSASDITAVIRFRAWLDGGGLPGAWWNGFTSNPITIGTGGAAYNFGPLTWSVPTPGGTDTLWAGMQFSGAADLDLAELGMFLYDPPMLGTSSDIMFAGDVGASQFGVSNPTGSNFSFGGSPVASAFYELRVSALPVQLESFSAE